MTAVITNTVAETAPSMSVRQALERRRAVRGYQPEGPMAEEEFERLMAGVLHSPTAYNVQNWRFVRVRNPALRRAIREAANDQPQITDAAELVVLCFDLHAWRKQPERYWRDAPATVRDHAVAGLRSYFLSHPSLPRDDGLRSCAMAAMSLMLLATEMGYQTCPMTGFDFAAVGRLLGLPGDHAIAMLVTIGHQSDAPWPNPGRLSLADVLLSDGFGAA